MLSTYSGNAAVPARTTLSRCFATENRYSLSNTSAEMSRPTGRILPGDVRGFWTARRGSSAGFVDPSILLWLFGGIFFYALLCALAGWMIRQFLRRTPGPYVDAPRPPLEYEGDPNICPPGECRNLDQCQCTRRRGEGSS